VSAWQENLVQQIDVTKQQTFTSQVRSFLCTSDELEWVLE
jgi:hypothetical protein